MGARLQARIERIEEQNAPLLELIKARRRIYDHFCKPPSPDYDYVMELYAYIGCPIDRETAERDYITFGVLGIMELEVRFPQRGRHTRAGRSRADIRLNKNDARTLQARNII